MRRRLLILLVAVTGVIAMAVAVQIVDQGTAEPSGKLFLASWLETQVWVDVPLFLAGLATALIVATVSVVRAVRRRRVRMAA